MPTIVIHYIGLLFATFFGFMFAVSVMREAVATQSAFYELLPYFIRPIYLLWALVGLIAWWFT